MSDANTDIDAVFRRVAGAHPAETAIVTGARRISYAVLDGMAGAVAITLRRAGVGRGDRVVLDAPRSAAAVAAMLGTLRAGAAYVPLDPAYPADVLDATMADAAPRAVLSARGGARRPGPSDAACIDLDAILSAPRDAGCAPDTARALVETGPEDLAYVMYTSGTTGRPKGVMVPHRAVLRLVLGADYVDLGAGEAMLHAAPLAFDASTFEIWGALLNGGRLVILEAAQPSLDEIAATIAEAGVTTAWLTAGLFHLMVDHRLPALRSLRQLLAGGDVLSPRHVATVRAALPALRLINGYGPTENTTFSCCYTVGARWTAGPVPIGRPIAGTTAQVRDPDTGVPVADGEAGELFVGGQGVALGYLNRPDLTAERFVRDTDPARPAGLLYRTGDLVRRRPDGNLEFLGRTDRQVKINGKRIELDAVETALRASGLVEDAAVIAVEASWGGMMAAAFVVSTDPALTDAALAQRLRATLPAHLAPNTIASVRALPLTPAGKVDRRRLAAVPPAVTSRVREPVNATEAALLTLWRRVLATEAIGPHDSFFEFGCTSMQLVAAHAAMRAGGYELSVVDVFRHATVAALAEFVAGTGAERSGPTQSGATVAPPGHIAIRRAGSIERMRDLRRARAR